jgi:hypothetical protein
VSVEGFGPFILEFVVDWSTTVLVLMAFYGPKIHYFLSPSASSSLPVLVMGFKPSILGLLVECSSTVLWTLIFLWKKVFSTFYLSLCQWQYWNPQPLDYEFCVILLVVILRSAILC